MTHQHKHNSKFLSLILRHRPETIGIELDENGWADVKELIEKMNAKDAGLDLVILKEMVATNDKKRFAFNEDLTKIRASQGHSVAVELALQATEPPPFLYHGTVGKFIDSIKETGLNKMERQYVHLSADISTAEKVGGRRGKPQILTVLSGEMFKEQFLFYLSENGVWLTDHVPPKFILFK